MKFKKVFRVLIILPLVLVGYAGVGPNATYNMGTTSFNYDLRYTSYMVELNGNEIGGDLVEEQMLRQLKLVFKR